MDSTRLILVTVVLVLVWQVVVPILLVVWGSLKSVSPGREGFWEFSFTLSNFARAYLDPTFWAATKNSLILATGGTAIAFVGAVFLAWVVERTNTPFRRVIFILVIGRMILPGIVVTIAWIFLLSPRTGWINLAAMELPFISGPIFNVYSLPGMIWILGLELIPTGFLLMSAAMRSIDPSFEEAAAASGTPPLRILRRVTLPLMRPAVIAIAILAFARGLEVFDVPALVGYPYGIDTYATKIYYNTATSPVDYGLVGAYAIILLALIALATFLYLRATRNSGRFMTVTGKGYRPRIMDLGRWRYLTATIAFGFTFVGIGLPIVVLAWNSLLPFIQPLSWDALDNLSLAQYQYVLFTYPETVRSFFNSFIISMTTGVAVALVAAVISWLVVKSKLRGRGTLDALAFMPTAIPGLVLGLAFLWLYLAVPWGGIVYGTIWIIVLAMVTSLLPFGMRVVSANMSQIHSELEEASQVSGMAWASTFRRIVLPLLVPSLVATWIWVALHAFSNVTTSLMLYSRSNQTVGVQLFNIYERGSYNATAALGIILIVVLTTIALLALWVSKRFGVDVHT